MAAFKVVGSAEFGDWLVLDVIVDFGVALDV